MSETKNGKSIVVGAGAAGMTMALLLAKAGRQVVLIEAQPRIGGYLRSFTRGGMRLDGGFHFTGGFENVLPQMLKALNLQNDVHESPLQTHIFLKETNRHLTLPRTGLDDLTAYIQGEFPDCASAIARYYRAEREVIERTPSFNLESPSPGLELLPYDSTTLKEFADSLQLPQELQAILGCTVLCHGTPPSQVPASYHFRAAYGLDDHIARVERGGDAFLQGFQREFKRHGVAILTNTTIRSIRKINDAHICQEITLDNGDNIPANEIFFAVHPAVYLPLLQQDRIPPNIFRRARRFQETFSFFTLYAEADALPSECAELTQYLSVNNLDSIANCCDNAYGIGIVAGDETDLSGKPHNIVTAFRTMKPGDVPGKGTTEYDTPEYRDFKDKIAAEMLDVVYQAYPAFKGKLNLLSTASPLTCSRFSPPGGSAYGIRQKIAEARMFGSLPIRNCYALGHNTMATGILGVMVGAFFLFRQVVGEKCYFDIIHAN